MEKKYKISQIDAFTKVSFKGNPAGVMLADGLTETEMQSIAREMNLSETAFLTPSAKADYKLQWFTPACQVELCGHATIASLHFLNENGLLKEGQSVKFDTLSGILNCGYADGKYYMQIPVPSFSVYDGEKDEILKALGITEQEVNGKLDWLILPNGYLFININKISELGSLKPDFGKIKGIKIPGYGVPQIVAFTLETKDAGSYAHSRFFAPGYGIDEDPVTGSANGPLIMALNKLGLLSFTEEITEKTFEQGDFIGHDGRVSVKYNKKTNEIYIAGFAKTVLQGEIIL